MIIEIKNISKKINPIYKKYLWDNDCYYQIYFGGSSSAKSYSMCQNIVLDCLKGANWLVIRKVGATLRGSTFNEIIEKIYNFKLKSFFKINKTELTITNTITNSQIRFCGADDTEKLKSIKPERGVFERAFLEEATEFSYKEFKDITKRIRGESKFNKKIILLFNPIYKSHWIYKEFFEGTWDESKTYVENEIIVPIEVNDVMVDIKKTLSILKTTYKDNNFLSPEDIASLESEADPYYYNVYTLGNWGVIGAVVFKNWRVSTFDKYHFEHYKNGLDWGFANDPFAFIRLAIDRKRKILYICDEIYRIGLLNSNSSQLVKGLIRNGETVYCDSAEPKSIAEYNQYGIKAEAVSKKSGSIEEGIKFIQGYEVIIHSDCVNCQNEFMLYKYKQNKNGDVLPEPVDKYNHCIDACRYAILDELPKEKTGGYSRNILRTF